MNIPAERWQQVDALHEQLLDRSRALGGFTPQTEAQRASLENEFIQELGTIAGAAPECVALIQLQREEARLRLVLRGLRASPRVASPRAVLEPAVGRGADARATAAANVDVLLPAYRAVNAALRTILDQVSRQGVKAYAGIEPPRSPLTREEINAMRAMRSMIQAHAASAAPEEVRRMEDRLALSLMGSTEDRELERIAAILTNLATIDAEQQTVLEAFVARLRQERGDARKVLIARLLSPAPEPVEISELIERGFGRRVDMGPIMTSLPPGQADTIQALCRGWDAYGDLERLVRDVLSSDGVDAVGRFLPVATAAPRTTKNITAPSSGHEALRQLRQLLPQVSPHEDEAIAAAVQAWSAQHGPQLDEAGRVLNQERARSPEGEEYTYEQLRQLERVAARAALVQAICESEERLHGLLCTADPGGGLHALFALWRTDRVARALDGELYWGMGPLYSWTAHPVTPLAAVCGLQGIEQAQKMELLRELAVIGGMQVSLIREAVLRRLAANAQQIAQSIHGNVEYGEARPEHAEQADRIIAGMVMAMPEAHQNSDERNWQSAWNGLQHVGEAMLARIRLIGPVEQRRAIMRAWARDAMPSLGRNAWRLRIEQLPPGPAKDRAVENADRNLPELMAVAFRWRFALPVAGRDDSQAPEQWATHINEDAANAFTRVQRDADQDMLQCQPHHLGARP